MGPTNLNLLSAEEQREIACAVTQCIDPQLPRNHREALNGPDSASWRAAMDKEMECLQKNNTFTLVPRTANMHVLGNQWVWRIKPGGLFKARIVVRGDWQIEGVDFFEVFAPTAKLASLRIVLHLAGVYGLHVEQVDFVTAFLNGDLEEDIFMRQVPGYEDPSRPTHVCKLNKALYGLRQAPRQWFAKLKEALESMSFTQSRSDLSIFFKRNGSSCFFIVVFVDDLTLAASDKQMLEDFKAEMGRRFEMKDLGELKTYLGIDISRDQRSGFFSLHQGKYITSLLNKFDMVDCHDVSMPLDPGHDLTDPQLASPPAPGKPYAQLVGSLMYLMVCTRPDLAFTICTLSRFMAEGKCTEAHWKAAKRTLRYLHGTKDWALQVGGRQEVNLIGWADASYGEDKQGRRSPLGFHFSLGSGPISWRSKLSDVVALSSTEAEYYAITEAAKEAAWIQSFLGELGTPIPRYHLWCDNQGAIAMTQNAVSHARTKHIDIKHHFIKDLVEDKKVTIEYVHTSENVADVFTKALPAPRHQQLCQRLLHINP